MCGKRSKISDMGYMMWNIKSQLGRIAVGAAAHSCPFEDSNNFYMYMWVAVGGDHYLKLWYLNSKIGNIF